MAICVTFLLFYLISPVFMDVRGARMKRIVGGVAADPPPEDDPAIYINFKGKAARVQGVREFPHYVFRGIKYALPPIGKNRFLRPKQQLLEGYVNATVYAPPCIQPRPGTNTVIGNEDCLALNVFTPELPTGLEGLPVVVWIHGGGFRYGSASQYGVRHLVGKQLVVVTIQYRLGSLGFLTDSSKQLPGNLALWDMVLAVQWVRNYIGFFGGNPYRIVVMGHDTGASSALLVALSNVAKGLPAGVIAMSGTAVSRWAVDNSPQNTANDIAYQNSCPTTNIVTMVKCLQLLPPESIIRGDSDIEFRRLQTGGFMSGLSGNLGTSPVTEGVNDGRSLPGIVENEPMKDLEKENNPKIPLLTGIVKDETKRAVKGYMKNEIVEKLKSIPDFIENVLVKNLKALVPLQNHLQKIKQNTENLISGLMPLNFKNYLQHNKKNLLESLEKISDVTNDVLFNVPAFLTVDIWSRNGAPTFLYSFEHLGKLKKGHTFLKGSPLIGSYEDFQDDNETVGHGDDLAYLFDANDVNGTALESGTTLSDDDTKVRDIFTQMISDFARYGAPKLDNKIVPPFSGKTNNFIQIKPNPKIMNNFKFCEMALWCNIAERLKSTSCQFLDALNNSLKTIENMANGLLNNTNMPGNDILNQLKNKSLDLKFPGIFNGDNISIPTKADIPITRKNQPVINDVSNVGDNRNENKAQQNISLGQISSTEDSVSKVVKKPVNVKQQLGVGIPGTSNKNKQSQSGSNFGLLWG